MGGGRGEGQEEEKNRPRGCTGSAANPQRMGRCDLRLKAPEEMMSADSEVRHAAGRAGVNLVIASLSEERADQKDVRQNEKSARP